MDLEKVLQPSTLDPEPNTEWITVTGGHDFVSFSIVNEWRSITIVPVLQFFSHDLTSVQYGLSDDWLLMRVQSIISYWLIGIHLPRQQQMSSGWGNTTTRRKQSTDVNIYTDRGICQIIYLQTTCRLQMQTDMVYRVPCYRCESSSPNAPCIKLILHSDQRVSSVVFSRRSTSGWVLWYRCAAKTSSEWRESLQSTTSPRPLSSRYDSVLWSNALPPPGLVVMNLADRWLAPFWGSGHRCPNYFNEMNFTRFLFKCSHFPSAFHSDRALRSRVSIYWLCDHCNHSQLWL